MSDNTFEIIGRHLILAVKPISDAFKDLESFRRFMFRLGWDVTSLPPSYSNLVTEVDGAVDALENLVDDPTLEEVLDLVDKVKQVYDAIQNISDAPAGVNAGQFLGEIAERLFEILLVDYLNNALHEVFYLFSILGVIENEPIESSGSRPGFIRTKFKWDEIPNIFIDPGSIPQRVYGWGSNDLKFDLISEHLGELFFALGYPVKIQSVDEKAGRAFSGKLDTPSPGTQVMLKIPFYYASFAGSSYEAAVAFLELPPHGGKKAGIVIQPLIPEQYPMSFELCNEIDLRIRVGTNLASLFGIIIRPDEISVKYPFQPGNELPTAGFGVGIDYAPLQPKIILGSSGATRLQYQGASFDFGIDYDGSIFDVMLGAEIKGLAIVLQAGESDGFMKSILGDGETKLDIPLGIEWSSQHGVKFKGGGGFEVALHPHLTLGPISIPDLNIRLAGSFDPPPPGVKLEVSANIAGDLGPLQFVVMGIGFSLKAVFNGGSAGAFGIELGFKPPNGVGLSVDTGVIKGGGFLYLDYEKGEYIGALELEFQNMFSLKAIGIINTKMPDGSDGFSLLIIITAEFTPIQLGFGFTLNGVGGLLGLNRTTKIDVLREGVKTNALKSILFPEDIIANINRIVSDLKAVFPIQEGHFIVGPMAKIGWASIVTLELGLLIELPEPRIVILGVLKAFLPTEDEALLKLQVNFLGVIDFENKYISFDASLYDSRLLIFTLSGDMALRISWGSPSVFILSVGGFHPAFNEAPPDLQNMTRLTISLLSGENPRITIQAYFAVTSNTVQFGAKVELYAEACGFNVWGYLGFDVLFQFDPFKFIAEIYAGLALRQGTSVIMGIKLRGALAGPTPWDVEGEASLTILFFEISVHFHETWGDDPAQIEKEKVNVLELLKTEFNDDRNWKAELPSTNNLFVTLKKIELPEGKIVAHPAGVLSFSEKLVPLDFTINKFGDKIPDGADRFSFSDVKSDSQGLSTTTLQELFAPANFIELSDSDKLSRKSFENMNSGFEIASSSTLNTAAPVEKSVEYEVLYLRKKRIGIIFAGIFKLAKDIFSAMTKGSAVSKSSISYQNNKKSVNSPDDLTINKEKYGVANVSDMKLHDAGLIAGSQAEAYQMYNNLVSNNPGLKDKVQVLSTYEMSEA